MVPRGQLKQLISTAHNWWAPAGDRDGNRPRVLELALLVCVLLLAAFLLPEQMRLGATSPHPFWIPVLLLTVQYGTFGGLAATLAAIGISALIGWPAQAGGEDVYDYSLRVWREPILWLGAAVILGALRAQQADKLEDLRERLAAADAQRQSIGDLFNTLKSHCEDLERRIACAQDRSIEAGLSALACIRNSSTETLGGPLTAAAELLFGPASYAVFVCRSGRLVESLNCGGGADAAGSPSAPSELPIAVAELLMHNRRVLSVLHEGDAGLLAGTALFAAPIIAPVSFRVLGAFVIRTMEAPRISGDTEASIRAICRALGHALSKDQLALISDVDAAHRNIALLNVARNQRFWRAKPQFKLPSRPSATS